jgi:hypothetical protein
MKVLYWNVYIGHAVDDVISELRGMIHDHNPHVVGLGEASRIGKRSESIKGYKAFWLPETHNGAGDTLVLVRDDMVPFLKHWNWKKFTKWWKGPKHGFPQGPKRFWNGRFKTKELGLLRLSIGHWPFNTALPEVEEWCVEWFKRPNPILRRKSVHLGDLNMQEPETTRFCKQFKGKNAGHRLDRAMFKNCHVTYRALGYHGSDHEAVLFNITK